MENQKAELLLESLFLSEPGCVVEIGCIREDHEVIEDGYSTYYLAKWCEENNKTFHSCDVEQPTIDVANSVMHREGLKTRVQNIDGKHLIASLEEPISVLFLDSHRHPAFTLDQYKAAELVPNAIVIIDDAQPIDEFRFGKAQFVKDFYDYHGMDYRIVETCRNAQYQWCSLLTTIPNGKKAGQMK